ncbi:MAG: ATP synthase F0 subunit B [Patescibacteria group bacterium]
MAVIFSQLGVDWRLLLAQGVNFLVVLGVLTVFVWKPLLRMMDARRERIEDGLQNAKNADARLASIEKLKEARMSEAEREAVMRISEAESDANRRAGEIIKAGEKKSASILKEGQAILAQRREEQFDELIREAGSIIRSAVAKAALLHPTHIDEKLIAEASKVIEQEARV